MNLSILSDSSERIRYQDPAVPIYLCCGNLRAFPGMAALCHWHEDVELLMPLKGYLNYNVSGHVVRIGEGDAIFVNSRQPHYGFTADGTDCDYLCLCFKPDLFRGHPGLYDRYVSPILTNSGLPWLLLEGNRPDHRPVLELLGRIGETEGRDLRLLGQLCQLWQGIFDLAEPEAPVPDDGQLQILRQMLSFIAAQYPERLNLDQIAAAGGVCRSRCCSIFKKYMDKTPIDYLTSYRLERAMELLRETSLSVTEVSDAIGFGSHSYFTRVFTQQKGCTPKEYRKTYPRSAK